MHISSTLSSMVSAQDPIDDPIDVAGDRALACCRGGHRCRYDCVLVEGVHVNRNAAKTLIGLNIHTPRGAASRA